MISLPTAVVQRLMTCLVILGLALLTGGCSSKPKVNDGDLVYIEDEALLEAIARREKKPIAIVDARPTARYEMAHIPSAISIPLPEAKADDQRLDDAKMIIVYALDWEDPVALAMSKKLLALGYKEVQTYRGGLREWVTKDRPTDPPIDETAEDAN